VEYMGRRPERQGTESHLTNDNLVHELLSSRMMRATLLLLLTSVFAYSADENLLALALRAQTDFDRVELAAVPSLPDTLACAQSQAMVLPVTRPAELSLIYYRKGYCELVNGSVSGNRAEYREAVHDFEKAVQAWPDRVKKGAVSPPVSSALRVLLDAA